MRARIVASVCELSVATGAAFVVAEGAGIVAAPGTTAWGAAEALAAVVWPTTRLASTSDHEMRAATAPQAVAT